MNDKENKILRLLKAYRIYNKFIPEFVKKRLKKMLEFIKVPPHTIGVFFNPNTSPVEQFGIIRYFMNKNEKKIGDIIKIMIS